MELKNIDKEVNVLVVDEMIAHFALLKTKYKQEQDHQVQFFSKYRLDDLWGNLEGQRIRLVIVFVYGRRSLHKVLPFLGCPLEIVLFTNERDLWWLSESLPQVKVADLALPKAQLFNVIDSVIQELRAKED